MPNPHESPKWRQHVDGRRSSLRGIIVTPEEELPIKPFGLDMTILLTTEATGGAGSAIMGWHKPGEGGAGYTAEKAMEISRKFRHERSWRTLSMRAALP